MVRPLKKIIPYEVRLIAGELFFGTALAALLNYLISGPLLKLNYELLSQSLFAFNSGIIVAMFIALFHGNNKNIDNFKKYKKAARQIYIILLVNGIMVCLSAVFIRNFTAGADLPSYQPFLNVLVTAIALSASAVNTRLIIRLLQISFRADPRQDTTGSNPQA